MATPITPGQLRHRIAIQAREEIDDGFGNIVSGDWQNLGPNLPARIHFLRGGEEVMAGRLQGKQTVIITVRSSTFARSINTDQRIVDANTEEIYAIISVSDTDGRRAYLDILAESGVAT